MSYLNRMDLTRINGIGEKNINLFHKLNIYSIQDLLEYYPIRYTILDVMDLKSVNHQDKVTVNGYVVSEALIRRYSGNKKLLSFHFDVNNVLVEVILFNRDFLKNRIKMDQQLTVIGKYDRYKNTIVANEVRFDVIEQTTYESVYSLTEGITNKGLQKYIYSAYSTYGHLIQDYIPKHLKEQYKLVHKIEAIQMIHFPKNQDDIRQALRSLKYEELFMFSLKMNALKIRYKENNHGIKKDINEEEIKKFIAAIPFELTSDQLQVTSEIINDLKSCEPMNRLVQGDVGSGKTVVSMIAAYANYIAGYQGALMVPTEILAQQHYQSMCEFFDEHLRIALLTGSTKSAEKEEIYRKLEEQEIDLVVGTHALIQEHVQFANLGLVITDEQHRFGVNQRAILRKKGHMVDTLYMSATPIPRTLALTIYGDMEVSTIKTMPAGRKEVITEHVLMSNIHYVLSKILEQVKLGHQVYVVTPLVEESDKLDLIDSYQMYNNLKKAFNDRVKMDILHGKMSNADKELVMSKFKNKEIDLLVSTTVIEVGVNVANATLMVIFDANRFGLSQLHQLRGRVGRNDLQSYCLLVSEYNDERLEVMSRTNDGFEISEEDLRLRGPGDFFGEKQSGSLEFKIANIIEDRKIFEIARMDAIHTYNSDDFNDDPNTEALRELLKNELKNLD